MRRYNGSMKRTVSLLFAMTCAFGCSGGSNQAGPDGGTEPGAGCRSAGYPCSPAEESPQARALSDRYVGEVQARLVDGESFEDIAAWLGAQEDIAEVIGDSEAVRFRVTDGAVQWAYAPPDGITKPVPTAKLGTSSEHEFSQVSEKAVLRENDSESNIKKKALVIEPFEEFIATPTLSWRSELEQLHDYETVDYFANRDVLDVHFGSWNEYRFVWVTTHGKFLPETEPEYSALYSSRMCKESGWLREEILERGNGNELTKDETTRLRDLFGEPRTFIEQSITVAQGERLRAYENLETENQSDRGVFCGTIKMHWIPIPGDSPSDGVLTNVPVRYWAYNEEWYEDRYGSGLENTFLYLRACSSNAIPVLTASGSRGAIVGWSNTINSANDDQTIGVLFDRMINEGETFADALAAVRQAGFAEFSQSNVSAQLVVVSTGDGGEEFRIREIISIVDPELRLPLPDEGAVLEAKEINSEGNTVVDVPVEVVGFGDGAPDEFSIQIFDGQGEALSSVVRAEGRFMMVPIEIPEGITEPKVFDIEARVSLPEGPESAVSKHPIRVTIEPPGDCRFSVTVAGNEVTGQSMDVATFQSEDFGDGALLGIDLEQADTGRSVLFGALIGDGFPRVLGPGSFVGGVSGRIGLQGTDTSYDNDGPAVTLVVSEYVPGEVVKGELNGTVRVLGPPPDYPERDEDLRITFEINVPPDFVPFLGYYSCTIP